MLERVVSGGQTGVDRAGLDVALELGIPCGGWCPRGRKSEDGRIPDHYPLLETDSRAYRERTARNVRDSGATLIVARGPLRGGTALTRRLALEMRRPVRVVDLDAPDELDAVSAWWASTCASVLNVAGPRESQSPGIHDLAASYLRGLLPRLRGLQ